MASPEEYRDEMEELLKDILAESMAIAVRENFIQLLDDEDKIKRNKNELKKMNQRQKRSKW